MDDVITFVPARMPGSFTTENCPFAACGNVLYYYFIQDMCINSPVNVTFYLT